MSDAVTPFEIAIPDAALDDLRARLKLTRFPEAETVDDWSQGVPLDYVKDLAAHWADAYDWRPIEAQLNSLPNFTTALDGLDIHFLHIRSPEPSARPLLMTHGWPGSVLEFMEVIGPLTNPVAHGGAAADAFHLVVPSLPGFGFSAKPSRTGWGVKAIATQWDALMRRLGYDRYFAQGGDWGSIVTTEIGVQNLGSCAGIHVTMPIVVPDQAAMAEATAEELSALASMKFYQDWDSGYSKQQSTRPQTLGYGLVDSPVGQLAWIIEKFYQWTDCDGHPENVISRDRLLDNVMVYWLNGAGASSARIYWESFNTMGADPVVVPSAISIFPKEIFRTSERWARKRYSDLRYFGQRDRGGHFAATEQPSAFVEELRAGFAAIEGR
ncbi:MAG: epoxide hydrolase family protein [Pseudomonadota bacterium]